MTIYEVIDEYTNSVTQNKRKSEKLDSIIGQTLKAKIRLNTSGKYTDKELTIEKINRIHGLKSNIIDGFAATLKSQKRDKAAAASILREFMEHLNKNYNMGFAVDEEIPQVIPNKFLRQVDMLKFLHEERTREDILQKYIIDERTLSSDLSELDTGIDLFGSKIHINVDRSRMTYNSTVHPIVLPLNLTEIFALTVGLKKMSTEPPMGEVYNYIAESVFSQLSDYGKRIIIRSAKENNVHFYAEYEDNCREYRREIDILKSGRENLLLYLFKSGQVCRIDYQTDTGVAAVYEGRIAWDWEDNKLILNDIIDKPKLPIDKIKSIIPKNYV